ncbi:MAG TPA: efflux RND transporter periplasmic adaptor subunit, partial [Polyangiaceae bacterium]|nr:efflux RND transporter periplasmic adaptor subunit [Polyangiaceae bacterium]
MHTPAATPTQAGKKRHVLRYVVVFIGLFGLIGGLVAVKGAQIAMLIGFGKAAMAEGPPPEVVNSAVTETQQWESTLSAVASVVADKGVMVSNDAAGVVSRIHFESGATVKEGKVLLELDSDVERAQLASAQARQQLAQVSADRTRALFQSNVIAKAELDNAEAQLKSNSAEVAALRAQIERKTVRAPFSGALGLRVVNLGQYLTPGTAIATLESAKAAFIDFSVPQQQLSLLQEGMTIRAYRSGERELLGSGTITAIDPQVDPTTRNVKVRASIPIAERLRPGMYLTVEVVLPQQQAVVSVPVTAIVHAPFGDSLFLIEPKKDEAGNPLNDAEGKPILIARQQFVQVGITRGDFVAVQKGIEAGQQIVSGGAFKLRNNARIVVDNAVVVKAELT